MEYVGGPGFLFIHFLLSRTFVYPWAMTSRFFKIPITILTWPQGSVADPWHFGVYQDPDPPLFVIDLQEDNKKQILLKKFFCLLLFDGTFTTFFEDKKLKEVTKQ
jgi:hypothetical protein